MYLLDTNVISETIRAKPNPVVLEWLTSIDIRKFYLSVLSLGEIRKGTEKLEDTKRKQKIIQWLEIDLKKIFADRIITVDSIVADKWGYICAQDNLPAVDSLLSASALVHNLKLVTRNVKDFKSISGLEIVNPWDM
jgi:predicted nucleic acid-binding protein